MTQLRQLPLFTISPVIAADLHAKSLLRDAVPMFQSYLLREGKSENTVKAFTADLQLLAEWGGEDARLGAYTTHHLNDFMHWLEYGRGVPCSRKSYARRVTTLKVFFKWLHILAAIPIDPANAILQRSGPAPLAEILSFDEIKSALTYASTLRYPRSATAKPDSRPELLFRLLVGTGIKKGETAVLTLDSVVPDANEPHLVVRHKSPKDVYKERLIAIDPALLPVYEAYLAQYRPSSLIFNCTPRNLEYILEDVGRGAGIENKLSFEMMRWTCAVRDYRRGDDPDAIREKLGLSKISWQETFSKIKRLTELQIQHEQEG